MIRVLTKVVVTLGALAVVMVKLVWPQVRIDAVVVTLLVLAAIPWLDGIFKSLQTPFGGVEYRHQIESRLDELAGAAESARHLAETNEARDLARNDPGGRRDSTVLADLAAAYDQTRASMKAGVSRTDEMTTIVGRMVASVERGADLDIVDSLGDSSGGRRLAAYVRLYVKPDSAYLLPLARTAINEEKPFGQYWAMRSLARVVDAAPELMDRNTLRSLRRLHEGLPRGSDRHYELTRILERLDP